MKTDWQIKRIAASKCSGNWINFIEKIKLMLVLANILEDDKYNINQKCLNIENDFTKKIKDNRRMIYPVIMIRGEKVIIQNARADNDTVMIEIYNNTK